MKGNELAVATLRTILQKEPQNVLLSGPKGLGKYSIAHEILSELPHPVVEVNGEGMLVEDCNALLQKLAILPDTGRRFILIDNTDRMTDVIQNKILKSVEENDFNVFVFVSHGRLLDTLSSRCSLIKFFRINDSGIASFLKEKGVEEIKVKYFQCALNGCVGNYYRLESEEELNKILFGLYELIQTKVCPSFLELVTVFGLLREKEDSWELLQRNLDLVFPFMASLYGEILTSLLNGEGVKRNWRVLDYMYRLCLVHGEACHDKNYTKQRYLQFLSQVSMFSSTMKEE